MPGPEEETPAKRPGFGARLARWWRSLLRDYAEACREASVAARRRPGRAALWLSLAAGAWGCAARNPGAQEGSFEGGLLEAAGALLLLSPGTRSRPAEEHARRLAQLRDGGRLRVRDLLLFSLLCEAPCDGQAGLYRARCPHLRPRWAELPGTVLDVGFWGRWWVLRARMRDADVDHEAFAALPAPLRRLSRRQLRSEANEALFEQKFRPVVLTEEQLRQAEKEDREREEREREQRRPST